MSNPKNVVKMISAIADKENEKAAAKATNEESISIREPKVFLLVGMFSFFLFPMYYLINNGNIGSSRNDIGLAIILFLASVGGIFVILQTLRTRIVFSKYKDFFTYRPMIGKTKEIKYTELISCKGDRTGDMVLNTKQGRMRLDKSYINRDLFLDRISKYIEIED